MSRLSIPVLDADGHVTESYQQIVKLCGENQIVYASDFPHWDHSYPGSIDEIKDRGDITDAQKRKILADNTRRLYGLKP
jgi:predicted TIM-barrel fold metal-dependent hydrolase